MDVETQVLERIAAESKNIVPQGKAYAESAVIVSHGIGAGLVVEDGHAGKGFSGEDITDRTVDKGPVSPGVLRLAYLVNLVGKSDHLVAGIDELEKLVVGPSLPSGEETRRKAGIDGLVPYLEISVGRVGKGKCRSGMGRNMGQGRGIRCGKRNRLLR